MSFSPKPLLEVSKETVRQWMMGAKLWRPRRSRWGDLAQWDATSRLLARFVRHDSTEENLKLVWSYLDKFGRPRAFYTDKASLFQTAEKRKRDEPGVDQDPVEMPPTQLRPRLTGVEHRVDRGTLAAGQGLRFTLHLLGTLRNNLAGGRPF